MQRRQVEEREAGNAVLGRLGVGDLRGVVVGGCERRKRRRAVGERDAGRQTLERSLWGGWWCVDNRRRGRNDIRGVIVVIAVAIRWRLNSWRRVRG